MPKRGEAPAGAARGGFYEGRWECLQTGVVCRQNLSLVIGHWSFLICHWFCCLSCFSRAPLYDSEALRLWEPATFTGTAGATDWDRGRPARPERGAERSGAQREKPLAPPTPVKSGQAVKGGGEVLATKGFLHGFINGHFSSLIFDVGVVFGIYLSS